MWGKTGRRVMAVAVVGMMAVVSGCFWLVAGAAGVAGVAYVQGELKATVSATPPQVVDAANAAIGELSIVKISSESTAIDGEVIGRTAGDERVKVAVKSKGEKTSEVSIRVGVYGDKALSQQILDKIKAKL